MPEFVRTLSPEEEKAVYQLLRSRTVPAGYYQRALIIHFSSQGETPAQIARRLEHKERQRGQVDPPLQRGRARGPQRAARAGSQAQDPAE